MITEKEYNILKNINPIYWNGTILESIDSYSSIYNLFGDNFLDWLTNGTEFKTVQQYIKFFDEYGDINE